MAARGARLFHNFGARLALLLQDLATTFHFSHVAVARLLHALCHGFLPLAHALLLGVPCSFLVKGPRVRVAAFSPIRFTMQLAHLLKNVAQ